MIVSNVTRKLKTTTLALSLTVGVASSEARAAEFWDYFSGCMMSMGAGMAGTAFANTRLEEGQRIDTSGYAIAGGLGCLTGMAFVGVMGSQAKFETEYRLTKENENLAFQLHRLSKERCLLKDTCEPGGRAILMDTQTEVRKQGDKVFETTTTTIEANE